MDHNQCSIKAIFIIDFLTETLLCQVEVPNDFYYFIFKKTMSLKEKKNPETWLELLSSALVPRHRKTWTPWNGLLRDSTVWQPYFYFSLWPCLKGSQVSEGGAECVLNVAEKFLVKGIQGCWSFGVLPTSYLSGTWVHMQDKVTAAQSHSKG